MPNLLTTRPPRTLSHFLNIKPPLHTLHWMIPFCFFSGGWLSSPSCTCLLYPGGGTTFCPLVWSVLGLNPGGGGILKPSWSVLLDAALNPVSWRSVLPGRDEWVTACYENHTYYYYYSRTSIIWLSIIRIFNYPTSNKLSQLHLNLLL